MAVAARTGLLRHRVRLLTRTRTPAGTDALTDSYGFVAEVWARVEEVQPTRAVDGAQEAEGRTHRVTIRWRADRDGFRWLTLADGRRLRVLRTLDPDGRRRWLQLECEEEVRP